MATETCAWLPSLLGALIDMYSENIWAHENNRLIIPNETETRLQSYKQITSEIPESGGLLLGRRIIGTNDGIVDEITSPMPGDVQHRTYFFRGRGHIGRQVQYWVDTSTTGQLLGVWHTHPEPLPKPSSTDLEDWKSVLKKCGDPQKFLYFVIVGQDQICVWFGVKRKFFQSQIFPCELVRQ